MGCDTIREPRAGQPITEGMLRQIIAAATAQLIGPNSMVDGTGVYIRPQSRKNAWQAFVCTETVPGGSILVDNGLQSGSTSILTVRKTQTTGERPIWIADAVLDIAANQEGRSLPAIGGSLYQIAYDITDGTPAAGETWGPVKDSFKLRKGLPGFKILAAGASGLVWAIYDGVGEPSIYGKLDGTLSPGGSATVSLYKLSGGTWIDTTINETAYAPPTFTVGTIAAAKWVRVKWFSQSRRLEVVNAEC